MLAFLALIKRFTNKWTIAVAGILLSFLVLFLTVSYIGDRIEKSKIEAIESAKREIRDEYELEKQRLAIENMKKQYEILSGSFREMNLAIADLSEVNRKIDNNVTEFQRKLNSRVQDNIRNNEKDSLPKNTSEYLVDVFEILDETLATQEDFKNDE